MPDRDLAKYRGITPRSVDLYAAAALSNPQQRDRILRSGARPIQRPSAEPRTPHRIPDTGHPDTGYRTPDPVPLLLPSIPMRLVDDSLLLAPTDLSTFLSCRHRTGLDLAAARHVLQKPNVQDPYAAMLAARGEEHEQRYVESLRAQGLNVVVDSARGGACHGRIAGAAHRRDAGGDAGRRRSDRAGPTGARRSGGLRRHPVARRAAERAGRVVLRGAGHQARARHEGRHHPAVVRVFGSAGSHAGARAGALPRGDARSRAAAPHLPRGRLSRLLPHGASGARHRDCAGPRAAPDGALSRAGGALRRVRLGRALLRPPPARTITCRSSPAPPAPIVRN